MKRNASRTKSFRIALLGPALAVLAAPVWAQGQKPASARYNVTDLGTLGGSFSLDLWNQQQRTDRRIFYPARRLLCTLLCIGERGDDRPGDAWGTR